MEELFHELLARPEVRATIVTTLVQAVAMGAPAGMKPLWCLAALSCASAFGLTTMPDGLALLGTPGGAAALVALAALEHFADADLHLELLVSRMRYVLAIGSAIVSSAVVEATLRDRLFGITLPPLVVQGGAVLLGVAVVTLRNAARAWIADLVQHVARSERWIARGEGGLVLTGIAILFAAPVFFVLLLVLFALGSATLLVVARTWEARSRVPCEACGELVREEALRCKGCQAPLTPRVWLVPATPMRDETDSPATDALSVHGGPRRALSRWTRLAQAPWVAWSGVTVTTAIAITLLVVIVRG